MSEFKVGDRVITRWDDSACGFMSLDRDTVPDGEHVIVEIRRGDARLDEPDGYWYPLQFMTKVEDAPTAALKECAGNISFRDECAMRAMEADWSSNGVANPGFAPETTDESLEKWAKLYYRMADAMMKARAR